MPDEKESVLIFSFIGFDTKREVVGSRSTIDVQMKPDLKTLEEVVVVGYGVQKKRDISGAIEGVSAEAIQQRQAINVMDALGTVAGLQISSNSGAPGSSNSVMIRGASIFRQCSIATVYC